MSRYREAYTLQILFIFVASYYTHKWVDSHNHVKFSNSISLIPDASSSISGTLFLEQDAFLSGLPFHKNVQEYRFCSKQPCCHIIPCYCENKTLSNFLVTDIWESVSIKTILIIKAVFYKKHLILRRETASSICVYSLWFLYWRKVYTSRSKDCPKDLVFCVLRDIVSITCFRSMHTNYTVTYLRNAWWQSFYQSYMNHN